MQSYHPLNRFGVSAPGRFFFFVIDAFDIGQPTAKYYGEVALENNVKSRRLELGLTVRKLAEISGVPPSTISEIETGKRIPNVAIAIRLARALRCNVDGLFVI